MNKLVVLLALVGAFSFLPLQSASAAPRGHYHGHGRHLVVHHRGPIVRGGYVRPYRCGPVVYRRPIYRACGPRYCHPRPWGLGIGIGIRI